MKSLFETDTLSEINNRINSLNKNKQPDWGVIKQNSYKSREDITGFIDVM